MNKAIFVKQRAFIKNPFQKYSQAIWIKAEKDKDAALKKALHEETAKLKKGKK